MDIPFRHVAENVLSLPTRSSLCLYNAPLCKGKKKDVSRRNIGGELVSLTSWKTID